jgi:hypothetical protein
MIEPTGFCWKCGRVLKADSVGYRADLFCCEKHEQQYNRGQDGQVRKGKKAGYGLAGSTH